MGSPIALFLSTGTFALLALLPKDAFLAWGWRVPFLLGAVLVVVGMVLRLQLFESPEFTAVVNSDQVARQPVVEVFRNNLPTIAIATGAVLSTVVAFYVQTLFVVPHAAQTMDMPRQTVLRAGGVRSLPRCESIEAAQLAFPWPTRHEKFSAMPPLYRFVGTP